MLHPGRSYNTGGYRYGFNGKENDNEVKGEGNQQDYGMRVYDVRIGKFLSTDPLCSKFPYFTPYQYAGNTPIWAIDMDGGEPLVYTNSLNYLQAKHSRFGYDIFISTDLKNGNQVILMNRPNTDDWYYLKNQKDGGYAQFFTDAPGNTLSKNVYWQRFKTGEDLMSEQLEREDRERQMLFGIGVLAAPATLYVAPVVTFLQASYAGRGALSVVYDGVAQLSTNGWNFKQLNLTSLTASFFIQSAKLGWLGLKNGISNLGEYNVEKGFVVFDKDGDDEKTGENVRGASMKAVIGTVVDKAFDLAKSLPVANKGQLTRWQNLSYKSKYAQMLQYNTLKVGINKLFGSGVISTVGNVVNGQAGSAATNTSPETSSNINTIGSNSTISSN
jgi:RHS repeat-associated protein